MFLTNLFIFRKKCDHAKLTPDKDFGYCPDCGKLVKNEWYITRCSCCGIKLRSVSKNGNVYPANTYCSNCGNNDFIVEKLDKINFIDINFAVLIKKEIEERNTVSTTQCWQEKICEQPKLLTQYL